MEAMKRVKVYTAESRILADMLVEMLGRNQIQAYRQGKGSGGYMDIYAGFSIFGEDIYVDEADAAATEQLIQDMLEELPPEQIKDEEEPEEAPSSPISGRYTKKQMMVCRIILIIFCAIILFSIIQSLF